MNWSRASRCTQSDFSHLYRLRVESRLSLCTPPSSNGPQDLVPFSREGRKEPPALFGPLGDVLQLIVHELPRVFVLAARGNGPDSKSVVVRARDLIS
eukprot:CAMPEP_0171911008 /NCGR_PEP_ID=MMETSP0993-20121228/9900_1 /TAXON_ID=483369 /ORGANISM="non described non described, Strain CCMP2098" /LENGTH=96 /DNA_ID=CAMNT_0012544359 /DNA_START=63 /DNA_END=353 /DNA_ORIENTATION=-